MIKLVKKYFDVSNIKDAIEEMTKSGIDVFIAYDIISFDAGGPCWIETHKYVVCGGVVVASEDVEVPREAWPPYEENGGGMIVEIELSIEIIGDDEWVKKGFETHTSVLTRLSDFPEGEYKYLDESESHYADIDGEDGICYRWIAGIKYRREGSRVIVSRYDYSTAI